MKNIILQGDALTRLKDIPEKSVDMCITSPPYWALRDYGVDGQLGLEKTFDEYINQLCDIFEGVQNVLKDDGTCWVNIGDTYSSAPAGNKDIESNIKHANVGATKSGEQFKAQKNKPQTRIPHKSLLMIPMRFAIEMVNRGWILRNTIIWHKPNAMPSSVKDRFTVDFEYIFLFSKNKRYYFETQYEPMITSDTSSPRGSKGVLGSLNSGRRLKQDNVPSKNSNQYKGFNKRYTPPTKGRIKRTVWSICTRPFKEAHFAVYPEELCETPINAGCPKGGIVLDPFFGAGTTGIVALKQDKNYIGIELNPEYIEIAEKRLKECSPNLNNTNRSENGN